MLRRTPARRAGRCSTAVNGALYCYVAWVGVHGVRTKNAACCANADGGGCCECKPAHGSKRGCLAGTRPHAIDATPARWRGDGSPPQSSTRLTGQLRAGAPGYLTVFFSINAFLATLFGLYLVTSLIILQGRGGDLRGLFALAAATAWASSRSCPRSSPILESARDRARARAAAAAAAAANPRRRRSR